MKSFIKWWWAGRSAGEAIFMFLIKAIVITMAGSASIFIIYSSTFITVPVISTIVSIISVLMLIITSLVTISEVARFIGYWRDWWARYKWMQNEEEENILRKLKGLPEVVQPDLRM
jgi:hypothetical protein